MQAAVRAALQRVPELAWRVSALLAGLLLTLFAMRPGFIRLGEWSATQSAENYFYQYNYESEVAAWFVLGFIIAGVLVAGFRSSGWKITLGGAGAALLALVMQPVFFDPNAPQDNEEISRTMTELQERIDAWSARWRRAPFRRGEIADAVNITGKPLPMYKAGRQYTYKFIVAGISDFPIQAPPVAAEPGDLYYTLSSDEKSYSLSLIGPAGNVAPSLRANPVARAGKSSTD